MNEKDFREVLSEIGNDVDAPISGDAVIKNKSKFRNIVIISAATAIVLTFAVIAAVIIGTIGSHNQNISGGGPSDKVLLANTPSPGDIDKTEEPGNKADHRATSSPTADPTSAPTNPPISQPTETPDGPQGTREPYYVEPFWLKGESLTVKKLGYGGSSNIVSFGEGSVSAKIIPTTVFGEHENCGKVYYNTETNETYCVYHEFLKASGVTVPEGYYIYYEQDTVRDDLMCIKIVDPGDLGTTDLWLFDMDDRLAKRVGLPEGSGSYKDIKIYTPGLCNGKLALCVSDDIGDCYISIFNSGTGEYQDFGKDAGLKSLTCTFLTETVLEVSTPDGYYAWNTANSRMFKLIGEHNIVFDGLLYSVKNWWGGYHKDVEVAVYNVETGLLRKGSGGVLALAVMDDGSYGVLSIDDETGKETVIMDHYTEGATAWSKDHAYFYAYSARDNRVLCYSVSACQWTFADVAPITKDPVLVEGTLYAVFNSCRLAVDDNCREVTLYHTRTLEEIPDLPDFEEQRVDSPYWDDYRDIAANNRFSETDRWYVTYKEDRVGTGWIGHDVANMDALRDIILLCLETRGERLKYDLTESDYDFFKMSFSYSTFRMEFFEKDGRYYLNLSANRQPPMGFVSEFSEIPEETFLRVMDMHSPYVQFTWISVSARIDDVSDPNCKVVLDESEKSYLKKLISSGNWRQNDFQGVTYFRYACFFIDGDALFCYEPNMKILQDFMHSTYIELTDEECAAIDTMLN